MKAPLDGTCRVCDHPYRAGDEVVILRRGYRRRYDHAPSSPYDRMACPPCGREVEVWRRKKAS